MLFQVFVQYRFPSNGRYVFCWLAFGLQKLPPAKAGGSFAFSAAHNKRRHRNCILLQAVTPHARTPAKGKLRTEYDYEYAICVVPGSVR